MEFEKVWLLFVWSVKLCHENYYHFHIRLSFLGWKLIVWRLFLPVNMALKCHRNWFAQKQWIDAIRCDAMQFDVNVYVYAYTLKFPATGELCAGECLCMFCLFTLVGFQAYKIRLQIYIAMVCAMCNRKQSYFLACYLHFI